MTNEEFIKSISIEGEEWRFINGTMEYFAVSNYGRIASMSHLVSGGNNNSWMTKPRILTAQTNRGGYLRVHLTSKHGVDITKLVHRIVAETFIPNPNNYSFIDHINGDRTDNSVNNLQWCTRSMNMLNPITRIRNSNSRKGNKPSNSKSVVQIKNGVVIAIFESGGEACRALNLSSGTLWSCCKNQKYTYKGYNWMTLSDWESSHQ